MTLSLSDAQKAQQTVIFEQLLKSGANPQHVLKIVNGYADGLTELLTKPLNPDNTELVRAYIQSIETYRANLKAKYLLD